MTIVEYRPLHVEQRRVVDAPAILDTTEMRWFVPGPLPDEIDRWFSGSTGVREERWDTYQLRGRSDIGVKLRHGTTIELKVRQSHAMPMRLGDGVTGSLEEWRRWSPAGHLVEEQASGQWIDVRKSIVKRRFPIAGVEAAHSSIEPVAGCDVEVAQVSVGATEAWTFAFAAIGPACTRRDSLAAAWTSLMAGERYPESFCLRGARSMGYPEWLALLDHDGR